MKKINIYTDLALEERERFKRNIEISGVKIDKNYNKELFMTTTDVEIFNENGAKSMGKPIGSYVTMETRLFKEDDLERQNIFAKEIANHMEEMTKNQNIKKILINYLSIEFASKTSSWMLDTTSTDFTYIPSGTEKCSLVKLTNPLIPFSIK